MMGYNPGTHPAICFIKIVPMAIYLLLAKHYPVCRIIVCCAIIISPALQHCTGPLLKIIRQSIYQLLAILHCAIRTIIYCFVRQPIQSCLHYATFRLKVVPFITNLLFSILHYAIRTIIYCISI